MRLIGMLLTFAFITFVSSELSAQEREVSRDIVAMGCEKDKPVCSLEVNGEVFGPEGCLANTLKFNLKKDANAEASLMLLSAAFLAGKKVKFVVAAECYDKGSSEWPTFDSFKVIN